MKLKTERAYFHSVAKMTIESITYKIIVSGRACEADSEDGGGSGERYRSQRGVLAAANRRESRERGR